MSQNENLDIKSYVSTFSIILFLSILTLLFNNCSGGSKSSTSNPVVQPLMAKTINTATGWSDSPYISRDGQRLYFMYSRYNYGPWIMSAGAVMPKATGPDREGLHKSSTNAWDESDIYVATKQSDGTWSVPVALGFNGNWGDSSGMEFNGGQSFMWLRGNGGDNIDLVTSTKNPDGTWGSVETLDATINSVGYSEDNPMISDDGSALWFVSRRSGGLGGSDVWFSSKSSGGVWSAPVNVGSVFNTSGDDDQPFVSQPINTGSDIFWNTPSGIQHCISDGTTCAAAPTTIVFSGCSYAAEISMPDDGQTAYFGCGNTTTGHIQIMYSLKQSDGSWGPAIPVD